MVDMFVRYFCRTVIPQNRVCHVICLSCSAYHSLGQKRGCDVLNLELDPFAERVTDSERLRKKEIVLIFQTPMMSGYGFTSMTG